jgi:hypothetical protein
VFRNSGQVMDTQAGCLRNQHGIGNLLTNFACASNLDDGKWPSGPRKVRPGSNSKLGKWPGRSLNLSCTRSEAN